MALVLFSGCVTGSTSMVFNESGNVSPHPIVKALDLHLNKGKTARFWVELALTEAEQTQGLMYRSELAEDRGMLFDFQKPQMLSFWMKNTLIPLDMIFLDKDWKVVDIIKNAQPCKSEKCELYVSKFPAKYVVEVGAS